MTRIQNLKQAYAKETAIGQRKDYKICEEGIISRRQLYPSYSKDVMATSFEIFLMSSFETPNKVN